MKRHASLIPLSHDHHMTLLLAQVLKKDAPLYKGMSTVPKDKAGYITKHFQEHLVKHFQTEENVLFAFAKGRDKALDNLIDELTQDHRTIAASVKTLQETTELIDHLNALGELIDSHIRKEERV